MDLRGVAAAVHTTVGIVVWAAECRAAPRVPVAAAVDAVRARHRMVSRAVAVCHEAHVSLEVRHAFDAGVLGAGVFGNAAVLGGDAGLDADGSGKNGKCELHICKKETSYSSVCRCVYLIVRGKGGRGGHWIILICQVRSLHSSAGQNKSG